MRCDEHEPELGREAKPDDCCGDQYAGECRGTVGNAQGGGERVEKSHPRSAKALRKKSPEPCVEPAHTALKKSKRQDQHSEAGEHRPGCERAAMHQRSIGP